MTFEPIYTSDMHSFKGVIKQINSAENNLPGLIFNYPPIPLWGPPSKGSLSIENIWSGSSIYSNNLYLHIPFCRQKCSFCYYSVVPGATDDHISSYLDCLEKEAGYYADATFADTPMDTVFVGGGTPSVLTEEQITRLFEKIIAKFDLSKVREITFECAPDSITPEKLKILKEHGVTRISMGVQSFDERVLSRTRREGDVATVIDRYYDIVEAGIDKVNIDLIAGVEEESMESMKETMDTLFKLDPKPSQVTLFTLSVRKGAIDHKYLGGDPVALFKKSFDNYLYARDRLIEGDYWQYSRNLFPSKDKVFLYQDNIWGRNGYVLALGVSGYSHTQNAVYQNAFNTKLYMQKLMADELPIEKHKLLSAEETLRRHLVLAMKHARIDLREVRKTNPDCLDLLDSFEPIFEALEHKGLVIRKGPLVEYTPQGVALADKYARLFYSDKVNDALRAVDFESSNMSDSFNFTL